MAFRKLDIKKEADAELIEQYGQSVTAPLENEPTNAYEAYVTYSASRRWLTDPENTTFDEVYDDMNEDESNYQQWLDWSVEYAWEERVMVGYYQTNAQPLV